MLETKIAMAILAGGVVAGAAITGVYHKLWTKAYKAEVQAMFAKQIMESWAEEDEEKED